MIGLERDSASAIELVGRIDENALSIWVRGDGAKLVDEPQNLGNLTLESIRLRIRVFGGVVKVAQPAGGGVVVEVSTPIAKITAALDTPS